MTMHVESRIVCDLPLAHATALHSELDLRWTREQLFWLIERIPLTNCAYQTLSSSFLIHLGPLSVRHYVAPVVHPAPSRNTDCACRSESMKSLGFASHPSCTPGTYDEHQSICKPLVDDGDDHAAKVSVPVLYDPSQVSLGCSSCC